MKFPPLQFLEQNMYSFFTMLEILFCYLQFSSQQILCFSVLFLSCCLPPTLQSKEVKEKYMRSEIVLNESHHLRLQEEIKSRKKVRVVSSLLSEQTIYLEGIESLQDILRSSPSLISPPLPGARHQDDSPQQPKTSSEI